MAYITFTRFLRPDFYASSWNYWRDPCRCTLCVIIKHCLQLVYNNGQGHVKRLAVCSRIFSMNSGITDSKMRRHQSESLPYLQRNAALVRTYEFASVFDLFDWLVGWVTRVIAEGRSFVNLVIWRECVVDFNKLKTELVTIGYKLKRCTSVRSFTFDSGWWRIMVIFVVTWIVWWNFTTVS